MRLRYVQLTRLVAVDEAAAVEAALDELLQSDHVLMNLNEKIHQLVQSDYLHALNRQSDHAVEHRRGALGCRDCLGCCMVLAHDEGTHLLAVVSRHSFASNVLHVFLGGVLEPDPSGDLFWCHDCEEWVEAVLPVDDFLYSPFWQGMGIVGTLFRECPNSLASHSSTCEDVVRVD